MSLHIYINVCSLESLVEVSLCVKTERARAMGRMRTDEETCGRDGKGDKGTKRMKERGREIKIRKKLFSVQDQRAICSRFNLNDSSFVGILQYD
jgi:hypothetical protein